MAVDDPLRECRCSSSVESRLCHDGRSLQIDGHSARSVLSNETRERRERKLTGQLLRTVTGQTSNGGILLANSTISDALGQVLGLCSVEFSLSSSVFFTARLLQIFGASQMTDRLNDGALGGVESAGCGPAELSQSGRSD